MTDIYALVEYIPYHDGTLLGAFTTHEAAQAAADSYKVDDGDWLVIHRVELDAPIRPRNGADYIEDEGEPNPRDIASRGCL